MPLQWITLAVLGLPATGALVLALAGRSLPRPLVKLVGPGAVWLAFVGVLILLGDSLSNSTAHDFSYWTWVGSGSFQVPFDLYVDRLAVFMGLVITGVGGLIVTYAVGYVDHEDDTSYARFFCYMDLFIVSMLLLVLSGNFVFLIMGWALVGLSSYLLIGFWYWRHAAVVAARKAFVMNVIGDIGMILATFVLFVHTHQVTYTGVFAGLPRADQGWVEVAAYLLLLGAVAKSAQLPLHTWLPDAMEGPTPVSALIHAATMVTAGVYLVGRMHEIYQLATWASATVALIGAITALFAASIAVVQTDIKRVLAYSTMSQIGYMFLAVGVGAYAAGFFHLLAHAFFKALLFMAAGNVIHAMHDEQDMRRFGGLWNQMRGTSVCFLIGSLSLVGIIPFVGFWSKELVLGDTFSKGGAFPLSLWAIGFVTALLTGFYTGRMWWLAFTGRPSPERPVEHPHEAPAVMFVPVVILAVLTTIGGFIQINAGFHQGWELVSDFLAPTVGNLPWEERSLDYIPTAATLLLGGATFLWARAFFRGRFKPWSTVVPWAQRLLEKKYYFDELYDALFVGLMNRSASDAERLVEDPLLDGTVRGVGTAVEDTAGGLSLIQNGFFRSYMVVFVVGALVAFIVVLVRAAG
jgi:NADH-quinone oxidoreductase subunit L